MTQRKIMASLSAAVVSVGLSAFLAGCQDDATRQVHGPSRPIMYGTDGNRGVSAPSAGVPKNTENSLGGPLIQSSPNRSSNGVVAGSSAGVDPQTNVAPSATTPGAPGQPGHIETTTTTVNGSGTVTTGGTVTGSGTVVPNRGAVIGETNDGITVRGGPVTTDADRSGEAGTVTGSRPYGAATDNTGATGGGARSSGASGASGASSTSGASNAGTSSYD